MTANHHGRRKRCADFRAGLRLWWAAARGLVRMTLALAVLAARCLTACSSGRELRMPADAYLIAGPRDGTSKPCECVDLGDGFPTRWVCDCRPVPVGLLGGCDRGQP